MNDKGPRIDPYGTPNIISSCELESSQLYQKSPQWLFLWSLANFFRINIKKIHNILRAAQNILNKDVEQVLQGKGGVMNCDRTAKENKMIHYDNITVNIFTIFWVIFSRYSAGFTLSHTQINDQILPAKWRVKTNQ